MAVYTNIFIATEVEVASAPLDGASPAEWFPTIGAKYITTLELSTLEALLTGQEAYALWDTHPEALDETVVREWENVWVHRIPDPLVSALIRLPPADIPQVAQAWTNTEELRRADLHWAIHYVGEMRDLAIRALAEGTGMYLWVAV